VTDWVEPIKSSLPEYAKDTRLNLDAVIFRSSLSIQVVEGSFLAAAYTLGNKTIVEALEDSSQREAAHLAALTMAQNNVWYPYAEMIKETMSDNNPRLRMNAILNYGGTYKGYFEAYCLVASILGKCHFCIKSHVDSLLKEGYTLENIRDLGRIASVVNALNKA
jgi:alkyl hydroperoxide reductase subunit D